MDTVFVKDVRINGPAHISGLRPGDRLLSVNGMAVAGTLYGNVVRAIQQTPSVLKLIVVPKDCDILQTVSILLSQFRIRNLNRFDNYYLLFLWNFIAV